MWIILGVLVAGVLTGMLVRVIAKYIKLVQNLQQVGVLALLFAMGVGIGGNKELLSKIQLMGVKSVVFAVLTTAFSIAFVYLATRIFGKGEYSK